MNGNDQPSRFCRSHRISDIWQFTWKGGRQTFLTISNHWNLYLLNVVDFRNPRINSKLLLHFPFSQNISCTDFCFGGQTPSAADSILCDEGPYLMQKSPSSFKTFPELAFCMTALHSWSTIWLQTFSPWLSPRYKFNWKRRRVMKQKKLQRFSEGNILLSFTLESENDLEGKMHGF